MKKVFLNILLCAFFVGNEIVAQSFKVGQKLYVSVKNVELTESESKFSKKSAELKYGDLVKVIEGNDKRSKVQNVSDSKKVGWISNGSLTKKKVIASGDGMGTTDIDEIAVAGKGFSEEAENAYKASNSNLDYSKVDAIEKITVKTDDLKTFIEEGNLKTDIFRKK